MRELVWLIGALAGAGIFAICASTNKPMRVTRIVIMLVSAGIYLNYMIPLVSTLLN